jgi:hypothetical protein
MSTIGNVRSRAPQGSQLIDQTEIDMAIQHYKQYFLVKDRTNVKTQRDRANGIYIKPKDHYICIKAEPTERWISESQIFIPPTEDVNWWQVGLRVAL